MEEKIQLEEIIASSKNIVFFGGAGVSTESGIPDFRSVNGLYKETYTYPPEQMISHTFYKKNREEFFRFYKEKMICLSAKPNAAHRKLAEWEGMGKLTSVITQNIDGLHQMAGSKRVLELHGSVHRNYCEECGEFFDAAYMKKAEASPKCSICGGKVKPDVVLYEEGLDQSIVSAAINDIQKADVLIVGGTSLVVYPAAGLIDYYRGNKLVLINRDATSKDHQADYILKGNIGEILNKL